MMCAWKKLKHQVLPSNRSDPTKLSSNQCTIFRSFQWCPWSCDTMGSRHHNGWLMSSLPKSDENGCAWENLAMRTNWCTTNCCWNKLLEQVVGTSHWNKLLGQVVGTSHWNKSLEQVLPTSPSNSCSVQAQIAEKCILAGTRHQFALALVQWTFNRFSFKVEICTRGHSDPVPTLKKCCNFAPWMQGWFTVFL